MTILYSNSINCLPILVVIMFAIGEVTRLQDYEGYVLQSIAAPSLFAAWTISPVSEISCAFYCFTAGMIPRCTCHLVLFSPSVVSGIPVSTAVLRTSWWYFSLLVVNIPNLLASLHRIAELRTVLVHRRQFRRPHNGRGCDQGLFMAFVWFQLLLLKAAQHEVWIWCCFVGGIHHHYRILDVWWTTSHDFVGEWCHP